MRVGYAVILIASVIFLAHAVPPAPRVRIPICPIGSKIMFRPDGEPRKCLPHQSNLCLNALSDNADASTVCCWHNQVDYFCCMDVSVQQCPQYANVTVVIHNNFPHSPFSVKSFHFRKGIESEIDFAQRN
ncbi:hypothetical protein Ddc_06287 [Ditylenchus destructor]|nr:hypothetical protein Ddc_06287 [Ditylenchus destructor]